MSSVMLLIAWAVVATALVSGPGFHFYPAVLPSAAFIRTITVLRTFTVQAVA